MRKPSIQNQQDINVSNNNAEGADSFIYLKIPTITNSFICSWIINIDNKCGVHRESFNRNVMFIKQLSDLYTFKQKDEIKLVFDRERNLLLIRRITDGLLLMLLICIKIIV